MALVKCKNCDHLFDLDLTSPFCPKCKHNNGINITDKTNVDTTEESPVIISLCTGIRGLERGLERALQRPVTVAAFAEIEAFIITNLIAGMEAGVLASAPVWTDLKTFPWEQFHGKVHGIVGGYPCQPFSVAGKQAGTEDPRHLWPFIKTGIAAVRPVFCFFENVRGHLNLGYEEVRGDLQRLGYTVREGIYSAEEVGAPHRRDRLFILAIRNDQMENSNGSRIRNIGREVGRGTRESLIQQRDWSECTIRTLSASELENSGLLGSEIRQEQTAGIEQSGENCMWNSEGDNEWNERESRQGREFEVRGSGNELADTNNERLQGRGCSELSECSCECTSGKIGSWPARPGQPQYDWEEKRVIESGLGITINGYNFRDDLLRAAGNGVVEQTAELAFRDLLTKF